MVHNSLLGNARTGSPTLEALFLTSTFLPLSAIDTPLYIQPLVRERYYFFQLGLSACFYDYLLHFHANIWRCSVAIELGAGWEQSENWCQHQTLIKLDICYLKREMDLVKSGWIIKLITFLWLKFITKNWSESGRIIFKSVLGLLEVGRTLLESRRALLESGRTLLESGQILLESGHILLDSGTKSVLAIVSSS